MDPGEVPRLDGARRRQDPDAVYDLDDLLTTVMVYLVTRSFATSLWVYAGLFGDPAELEPGQRLRPPAAYLRASARWRRRCCWRWGPTTATAPARPGWPPCSPTPAWSRCPATSPRCCAPPALVDAVADFLAEDEIPSR